MEGGWCPDLEKAWEEFKKLPVEERKPKLGPSKKDAPDQAWRPPPPGSLILRAYWNYLERDARGELSPGKFDSIPYNGATLPGSIRTRITHTDVMWITEKDFRSIRHLPSTLSPGDVWARVSNMVK